MKLKTKVLITLSAVIIIRNYTHSSELMIRKDNPYSGKEVDLSKMSSCKKEQAVTTFITKMNNTDVIKESIEKNKMELLDNVKDLIFSNPYTDLTDVANNLLITELEYANKDDDTSGSVTSSLNEKGELLEQVLTLSTNDEDTFMHEIIHTLYPSISDSLLFEEGLTELMSKEYYQKDPLVKSYSTQQSLIKMMIEIVDVDPFLKMRATGSLKPLKDELYKIGVKKDTVTKLLLDLEKFHCYNMVDLKNYLFDGTNESEVEKYMKLCPEIFKDDGTVDYKLNKKLYYSMLNDVLLNINKIYEIKYGKEGFDNPIMKVYLNEIKLQANQDVSNELIYNKIYFSNKNKQKNKDSKYIEIKDNSYFEDNEKEYFLNKDDININVSKEEVTCK